MTDQELLARLLSYTKRNEATGCLEWTRCLASNGYGLAWDPRAKRKERTHRLVYELIHGELPQDKYVCHKCDNPICINPDHLWLGDAASNMDDKKKKGRAPSQKGEAHGRARLKEEDLPDILEMFCNGVSYRKIAKHFGVGESTIRKYLSGKSWTHAPLVLRWRFSGGNLVTGRKRAA